jgi:hypothetical protein
MSKAQPERRYSGRIATFGLAAALLLPWSPVHAGRTIEERRAADPQGEIEIVNVAGRVEVDAWDRSEIEVTGTAGDDVERVDVTSTGNRTVIHVLSRYSHTWGSGGEAHLVVHVPAKSAVTATLVGADFKVTGVLGDLKLQSVSGSLSGDAGGNIRATTVSGAVRMMARAAKAIEVKTISGDIQLTGAGGEVDVATVSGNATLEFADVSRGRFNSVSGDMTVGFALLPEGQIEGQSVSGNVNLNFAAAPAAEFDVQTFSGDIKNCFGPKPVEQRYGSGSRLQFTTGDGHARVRVTTKSGDVRVCVRGKNAGDAGSHSSALSLAQLRPVRMVVPYVY